MTLSCQPQFQNTALQPLLGFIQRSAGITREDAPEARVRQARRVSRAAGAGGRGPLALFAAMLEIPPEGLYEPPAESPKLQRQRFFAAAAELMLAMADGAPLLLCMEDLHWADPTTLEFAASLVGRIAAQPVMLLATCRPDARGWRWPRTGGCGSSPWTGSGGGGRGHRGRASPAGCRCRRAWSS